jgi:phage terminase Nu1 subunit (DNA packaging protein)
MTTSANSAEFSVLSDSHCFDPIDLEQMRLLGRLTPGQRIRVMLDARELAVGLIRGRLRRQYPDLSLRDINLKVLEEIARAERTPPRP